MFLCRDKKIFTLFLEGGGGGGEGGGLKTIPFKAILPDLNEYKVVMGWQIM